MDDPATYPMQLRELESAIPDGGWYEFEYDFSEIGEDPVITIRSDRHGFEVVVLHDAWSKTVSYKICDEMARTNRYRNDWIYHKLDDAIDLIKKIIVERVMNG